MAHCAVIGDDRRGPVAEASTREQCNALYPGSNPGRASSLRCFAASARQASPEAPDQPHILSLRPRRACRAVARSAKVGKSRLMAPFGGFAGAESGLKTTRARGKPALLA